jgi:hypothetical protein
MDSYFDLFQAFDRVDRLTQDLVVRMQLNDLDELSNREDRNGKRRQGELTDFDFDLAVELQRNELTRLRQYLATLNYGRRFAEVDDRAVRNTANGRSILQRFGYGRGLAPALPTSADSKLKGKGKAVDRLAKPATADGPATGSSRLGHVDGGKVGGDDFPLVESSAQAASRQTGLVKCDVCWVEFTVKDVACNPCNHKHCRSCLKELVEGTIAGRHSFPLSCCGQDVPLNPSFLPAQLIEKYQAKKVEFETPDPTYCHVPTCSKFIPKENIQRDIATCTQCRKGTCVFCKGAKHVGDCPLDEATQEVLSFASKNGNQRCYKCRHVVQITSGCNHISETPSLLRTDRTVD